VSLLAFTITMNRIVSLRLSVWQVGRLARRTFALQQDDPPFTAPTCPGKLFRKQLRGAREAPRNQSSIA
jgi:cytochrome oxidase assembly protein ShyY1